MTYEFLILDGTVNPYGELDGELYTDRKLPPAHSKREAKECALAHAMSIHPDFHGCIILVVDSKDRIVHKEPILRPAAMRKQEK